MRKFLPSHFILYVADQAASTRFYRAALQLEPTLEVPGMTEFTLAPGVILGLMPEAGIVRLLGNALPDPAKARGAPRAELYLHVPDVAAAFEVALAAGAKPLSPPALRNWGDIAAYACDPDGHVLAFARTSGDH